MKIERAFCINGFTLFIYYHPADYWQFAIVSKHGKLWQPEDIFFSPDWAERDARQWIKVVLS
jgi:hypothetical protein